MNNQLVFRKSYIDILRNKLQTSDGINLYRSNEFVFDTAQVLQYPNIYFDQNLIDLLDPEDDMSSAIHLYESYKNLNPLQASDDRLWTYLAHADLYPYMVARWPGVKEKKVSDEKSYILEHYILSDPSHGNLMRHGLSGLWWAVHLSKDEEREDPYELSRILLRQLDFATRTLGSSKLGRHKGAMVGILQYIKENEEIFATNFEAKTRLIVRHLNAVGGLKPIGYLDKEYFKKELERTNFALI